MPEKTRLASLRNRAVLRRSGSGFIGLAPEEPQKLVGAIYETRFR